jgi:membrane protein YqaA with SNARE-associated domain
MKFFSFLYNKMISWSLHKHAPYYLAGVSFAESSFFPLPPDVMLLSMSMAQPKNAWRYALITTFFSVLGGIFGYMLGYFAMEFIQPYIDASSYQQTFYMVQGWFLNYGVWVIFFAAGFSPVPYKLFTIAAGAMNMSLLPFIIASWFGRGLRFYLVSALMYYYGERLQNRLEPYIERIGWVVITLLVIFLVIYKWVL